MLRSRIIITLVAVIVPTFLLVTLLQNRFAEPLLQNEVRQFGVHTAKTLIGEIEDRGLMTRPNREALIEKSIQELIYTQPNIKSIEVKIPLLDSTRFETIASNIEYSDPTSKLTDPKSIKSYSEIFENELGDNTWLIIEPFFYKKKLIGIVEVEVSTQIVQKLIVTIRKITFFGAFFSILILIFLLNYFLKKSIERDQKYDWISKKLYDTERRLLRSEKLAAMGQLTASLAHEVGTPLTSLSGHLQMLKDEIPESTHPRVQIIESQAQKISETIQHFLKSTRQPTTERKQVDIIEICKNAQNLVQPLLDNHHIIWSLNITGDPKPLMAVPLEIEHIVMNLVQNAIDAIREKIKRDPNTERKIEISLQFEPIITFSIKDTGIGISKTEISKLFDPFYTTKAQGEGTGLGLSIVKDWVHKNHGTIQVDSEKDAWTQIQIMFPYSV